ncbi:hypothetical protein CU048_04940 [Beijerinckiaceae bacterium]|nr:hypothetical protein CU048_04940 [Beijerinckiaceae bacterium]
MIPLLALWVGALSVVSIFNSVPPENTRQNVYGIALWILSCCILVISAAIFMVSIVSPLGIHPQGYT